MKIEKIIDTSKMQLKGKRVLEQKMFLYFSSHVVMEDRFASAWSDENVLDFVHILC